MASARGGTRSLLRVRAAVGLTSVVAVLSLATGLVALAAPRFEALGVFRPFVGLVPAAVRQTAGFTGTLTAFLMLLSAYGLRRGLRLAWRSTVVLLPVTAVQGLLQSSPFSVPLIVLSLAALPAVLLNRRAFTRDLDLSSTQLAALAALVGAQAYGTVGAFALREQFSNVATLTDALYFAVVTASTVGYGDVTPTPESQVARLFTTSYVVLGTASFAVALGSLLGPAIEARLSRALGTMNETDINLLDDHIVVVGISDLTAPIIDELLDEHDFAVVTRSADRAALLRDRGAKVIVGDPSDEDPLRSAGIERARSLIAATDDDAQDALAILTARELNPDLRIVAAATERENVKKLRRAGADTVLSPATIGGHLLVRSALGSTGMEAIAAQLLESGLVEAPGPDRGDADLAAEAEVTVDRDPDVDADTDP